MWGLVNEIFRIEFIFLQEERGIITLKKTNELLLMKAFRFSNYILSTVVGFAKEMISYRYRRLTKQEDIDGLALGIQRILNGSVLYILSAIRLDGIHEGTK